MFCRDYYPGKKVICVEGDSAFGFSGMEIETMIRYNLPIIIVIVNNGGIYGGFDQATFDSIRSEGDLTKVYETKNLYNLIVDYTFQNSNRTPPTALTFETKYEKMMQMFGHNGYLARDIPELQNALNDALTLTNRPTIINVIISPSSDRKPQTFAWLTESKL